MSLLSMIALPGFLGKKEDWHGFEFGEKHFIPMDLLESSSMPAFAEEFNSVAAQVSEAPRVLMGYSLGARLGLHALLNCPKMWSKAILVSAHPGLTSSAEREARRRQDAIWAEAFLKEPWDDVIAKWEGQAVFSTCGHRFDRSEAKHSRTHLAHCMMNYSLSTQNDLRKEIATLNLPILWITGEKDTKFAALAKEVHLKHCHSQKIAMPAGHRVPWEVKSDFQKGVYRFLE